MKLGSTLFLLLSLTSAMAAPVISEFLGMDAWIGQAIAAAVGLVIGFAMVSTAKSKMSAANLAPTRTAENVRKDASTVKESLQ